MQTVALGVDKQWDNAVYHREIYIVTCDRTSLKMIWEKEYIYIYMWFLKNKFFKKEKILFWLLQLCNIVWNMQG